jgi:hypothetical protein
MNHGIWRCSYPGCGKVVKGIYCQECRIKKEEDKIRMMDEAREARAEGLRRAWAEDPEGMRERIAAGRRGD